MIQPEHYFAERTEQRKRNINIIGAQEGKDGSIVSHLVSALKGFVTSDGQDVEEALKDKSANSLKSFAKRQSIQSR